jgi:hypothetical protein
MLFHQFLRELTPPGYCLSKLHYICLHNEAVDLRGIQWGIGGLIA